MTFFFTPFIRLRSCPSDWTEAQALCRKLGRQRAIDNTVSPILEQEGEYTTASLFAHRNEYAAG